MAVRIGRAASRVGIGGSSSGGASTFGTDALARVPVWEAGEAIPPNNTRFIGGRDWFNPTASAITPTATDDATLLGLGLVPEASAVSALEYNATQTTGNVTHGDDIVGVIARTAANATNTRFPEGLPIGTERKVKRIGANNADIYIDDGTTEIIDGSGDGGIRINVDGGYVMIKKRTATAWETVEISSASISTPAPTTAGGTHVQAVPATVWTINHNLGRYPVIQAYDDTGNDLGSIDFTHVDLNTSTITWATAQSGGASYA